MKKQFFLLLIATFACISLKAQDTIRLKEITKNPKSDRYKLVTDRPPQALFVELGGEYGDLVVNYDRRFSKRVDGFGFKVGVGKSIDHSSNFLFNTGMNYIVGNNRKGRFLEVSLTQSFYLGTETNITMFGNYTDPKNITQFSLGYRSQPTEGGFNFRGGIAPIIYQGSFDNITFYLSFGFNF